MVNRERLYQIIRAFRLMDDDFMVQVFDSYTEGVDLLLNIILERSDMETVEVTVQREYKNVAGRSVRLDILAKDRTGKVYNIEVQRSDHGADSRRTRFYSSMLDTQMLRAGEDFSKLADSYVIMITEHDVLGEGLPLYHIRRFVEETGKPFGDGTHIIYVNGEYQDQNTPVGRLMHDFKCTSADDMFYPLLADKVRYFKEDERGQAHMCKLIEDFRDECRREAIEEGMQTTKQQNARAMLKLGKLSYEEIAQCTGLSVEAVKALDENRSA